MTAEVRRPLSPMERWYWICDQISPLNVVARVHLSGAYPTEDLDCAGVRLAQEHPLLRVAIAAEPDGSGPRFVAARDARIPVRTVRSGGFDADRWEREVADVELVSSLDWRSGPLARVVDVGHDIGTVDERHDLILTLSHVVADGTTALELLRRLVELTAGDAPDPRQPLPPPEALLPRRINGLPRAVHAAAVVIADGVLMAARRPRRLAPMSAVPAQRRRTRLIRREIDAEVLRALVSRCRLEHVTVHSVLTAAMAIAVAQVARFDKRAPVVSVGAPVDFRAELVPPVRPREAGAYVATVPSYVRLGRSTGVWTAARSAFRDLRRRRRFHQQLALVSLLRRISPPSVGRSAKVVDMIDRIGPGNVCLSNLGRVDFPDRVGRWGLSGAQFCAGISISGYLVAAVNTSHAALHWNFTYIDGVLSRDRAEQIADTAVRTVLASLREVDHSG